MSEKGTKYLEEEYYENSGVKRNNLIFAIFTLLFQIAAALLYAFLLRPRPNGSQAANVYPVFMTWAFAMLATVGNKSLI